MTIPVAGPAFGGWMSAVPAAPVPPPVCVVVLVPEATGAVFAAVKVMVTVPTQDPEVIVNTTLPIAVDLTLNTALPLASVTVDVGLMVTPVAGFADSEAA